MTQTIIFAVVALCVLQVNLVQSLSCHVCSESRGISKDCRETLCKFPDNSTCEITVSSLKDNINDIRSSSFRCRDAGDCKKSSWHAVGGVSKDQTCTFCCTGENCNDPAEFNLSKCDLSAAPSTAASSKVSILALVSLVVYYAAL